MLAKSPVVRLAIEALFPSLSESDSQPYRGRWKTVHTFIGKRTSIGSLRQYYHGRRHPPKWLRAMLIEALRKRAALYQQLLVELDAYETPEPPPSSLIAWHAKRRQEAAERAKKEEGTTALPDRSETGDVR